MIIDSGEKILAQDPKELKEQRSRSLVKSQSQVNVNTIKQYHDKKDDEIDIFKGKYNAILHL